MIRDTAQISHRETSAYSGRWKESWKDSRLGIKFKCWPQEALFSARFLLTCLPQYLMSGSADCTNASIEEGNISKVINFRPSNLFAREIFIAPTDFSHPL
jgi:hypothetical protein